MLGDNEWRYFEDTVPLDDDDDDGAFETQVVNLAGETQVVEIAGETQALDDFDTQLLDEGSESDGTQVLENVDDDDDDDDGVFVDDRQCSDSAQSTDREEVPAQSTSGHGDKKQTSSTSGK